MINTVNIEKYCAETDYFTLKVHLIKGFKEEQLNIIKTQKKCMEISDRCLLVRDQNTIIHLYNDKDICLIANARTVSSGIGQLEALIRLVS